MVTTKGRNDLNFFFLVSNLPYLPATYILACGILSLPMLSGIRQCYFGIFVVQDIQEVTNNCMLALAEFIS